MKLSAFTVLRNCYRLGYPAVEACLSVIDHVDEYLFAVCDDDESTRYYCRRLQRQFPDKIKIVTFPWPEGGQTGRSIGAAQTEAMRRCTGDYLWLVQADEIYWPEAARVVRPAIAANPHANAFSFPFDHVIENFRLINPNPAYRSAIRVTRNRPDISSGGDGWTAEGAVHPVAGMPLPRPIFHCGQIGGVCARRKHQNHALLYPDLPGYQETARAAKAELAAGDIGEQWERTEPLVDTPPILRALVGVPEYYVRLPLLTGDYRRLLAG